MRLFDILHHQLKTSPKDDAFAQKKQDSWRKYSTEESVNIVNQMSQGLIELGVKPDDKIVIVSEGRPEWCFVDLACQQIGAILVPLYPTLGEKDYQLIIKEVKARGMFVSNEEIVGNTSMALASVQFSFTFEKVAGFDNWVNLVNLGKGQHKEERLKRMEAVKEDDTCTIIYTSGTSGRPKGVMLSHQNIVSNLLENMKASTLEKGDRALSFLPLNHIYEKAGVFFFMHSGVGIYFAESMDTIADNLKEVKPHTFNTVPRLLEKVFDKIMQTGSELPAVKRAIFNWSVKTGLKFEPSKTGNPIFKRRLAVANKLVFSKWREALGGNIKQIQCGASALQPRLARVFWAAGIKVLEGYGLTETSPVIAANRVDDFKFGTVGKVYDNLELKFGEGNEIIVRGPSVMQGYYKNEELTREVLSEDGWFKTGDVGKLEDGYLYITDRKKELFKTSGGLYIAPQQIENQLKESIHIDQAMVVGDGKKFPAALIVPNFEVLIEELSNNFEDISFAKMVKDPRAQEIYQKEIDRVNTNLGKWEKLKKFKVLDTQWSSDTGELTPTLKLKRRVILQKHQKEIEKIYSDDFSKNLDNLENMEDTDVKLDEVEKLDKI